MPGNGDCVLVTGAAGFIGAFLCRRLLEATDLRVVGYDNLNSYYDVQLKEERLDMLRHAGSGVGRFSFVRADLADAQALEDAFSRECPQVVVNLAAQAGVRWSIDHPRDYVDSNVVGFLNVLECCRRHGVRHLVYASSSSVYGDAARVPLAEADRCDTPVSLYAATKRADELLAHSYAVLHGIPCTGLRFFTVYGPMGRPDMAYFKFADLMVQGRPVQLYNDGDLRRDFTYVEDVVDGLVAVVTGGVPGGGVARPPLVCSTPAFRTGCSTWGTGAPLGWASSCERSRKPCARQARCPARLPMSFCPCSRATFT